MREILLRLADAGKTLIVTSHILPELARICNRVAIITNGKLRAAGTLDEIMSQVCQERTIEIQLSAGQPLQHAAEMVNKFADNKTVSPSEAESMLRFRTSRSEDDLGVLLKDLMSAGVAVTQFREVAADLEDAFLSVTATK
jgi:ABC-2 type transport system ATP-binding protein